VHRLYQDHRSDRAGRVAQRGSDGMSSETDRIVVPTNGKGPHRVPAAEPPEEPPQEPADAAPPTVTFTPTQLAVGFGILASLVLLVVRQARRRGRPDARGPFGRR
jgi:hypothetical protein